MANNFPRQSVKNNKLFRNISSRLLRLSPSRGLNTRFSLVFIQRFTKFENKENLFDFVIHFYFQSLCFNALRSSKVSQSIYQWVENEKIICQIVGVCKVCDKMVAGYLRATKVSLFTLRT